MSILGNIWTNVQTELVITRFDAVLELPPFYSIILVGEI